MNKKTIIIAEIGVNHNGSLNKAKKLIDVAKSCKADYIKFQSFDPDNLIIRDLKKSNYQKKRTFKNETLFDMLKKLTFNFSETKQLFSYAKKIGIKCLSTPFDNNSIDLLEKLNVDLYKVSSGDINNFPLLEHIARKKKPIIISTGRSFLKEVKETIKFLNSKGCKKISILHCTSSYPARYSDLNLRCIDTLKKTFNYPIGYSDHSLGTIASIMAVSLGASIIEKHLTLNRNDKGPDHLSSLEPKEFKILCENIRIAEKILGSSIKKPTKKEMIGRITNRRGLYAATDLKKNQVIEKKDISIKRPEAYHTPKQYYELVGKKLLNDLKREKPFNDKDLKKK